MNVDLEESAREAIIDNGIERGGPTLVEIEVEEILTLPDPIAQGASDLRHWLWSSIDNRRSEDLDQVECVEQLRNGGIGLMVGIADGDSLVKEGSAMDRHAAINTVSVYTESEIFPVLPPELSTDLTSLNHDEERWAIVVELIIKENGDVPGDSVLSAVMRSRAKLSYEEIGNWLDDDSHSAGRFSQPVESRKTGEL